MVFHVVSQRVVHAFSVISVLLLFQMVNYEQHIWIQIHFRLAYVAPNTSPVHAVVHAILVTSTFFKL